MKDMLRWTLLMMAFVAWMPVAQAQQAAEEFGKNRIQYKSFEWRYYSSGNFDLYFYQGGNELAELAVDYLKDEYEHITDIVGYVPLAKTKIFLYTSISDLHQSNIGVSDSYQSVAGETVFVKNVVEIAYPGSLVEFQLELKYQVASKLLQEMMYGGSLSDMFQNAYLLNLPDWFIPGVARYVAYGWGPRMDDYVRDLMLNGRVRKLDRYSDEEAVLLGQSIWNYIAEKYGKQNISSVLNLARIMRNEERGIANTLGTTFERFKAGWQDYYLQQSREVLKEYEFPRPEARITAKNRRGVTHNRVSMSPNGRYLAYTINDRGRYAVELRDREKGDLSTVVKGGYRLLNQQDNDRMPILAWQDSTTLAVLVERRGSPALWLYSVTTGKKTLMPLSVFSTIQHISFNDNGRLMVVSAEENGKSDIHLVSLRRNVTRKLTNDAYDDLYPEFVPGTNAIVFSSNRSSDTLRSATYKQIQQQELTYNLFVYNLDTTSTVLSRLTNTLSTDIYPIPINQDEFYYLSDQKGVINLFRYHRTDSLYTQVTNFATSLKSVTINRNLRELAFVAEVEAKDHIFIQEMDLTGQRFTLPTQRQQRQQARYVANRLMISREREARERIEAARQEEQSRRDSDAANVDESAILDPNDYEFGTLNGEQTDPEEIIDTENYVFSEPQNANAEPQRNSFLLDYRRTQNTQQVSGPFDYRTRFSANNLVTSLEIDPLMGWGFTVKTDMNDLLENHHFEGGAFATTNLRSGDVYLDYAYLPAKVDLGARVNRKTMELTGENGALQRYSLNQLELKAALPFSVSLRSEGALFVTNTQYQELTPAYLIAPPPTPVYAGQTYVGARLGLVFDNTLINGTNLMEGTRGKVGLKNYYALGDQSLNFGNLSADIRHYQPIHRNLILALRGFYGWFYGQQEQSYLLGGMDNWLFRRSDNLDQPGNPLAVTALNNNSQLLFLEYVTSLRGFNYNVLNGRNALLANAELRLPLVRYFYSGPVTSNFFRNLQLTGFYDIGSSWTGPSPWSPDNELNTRVIDEEGSNFRVELKNYNNPWLMSYGVGLRSVILGYYTKFDLAWPIENYRVQSPRLFVTVGYDF